MPRLTTTIKKTLSLSGKNGSLSCNECESLSKFVIDQDRSVQCADCGDVKGLLFNNKASLKKLLLRKNPDGYSNLNCANCHCIGDFEITLTGQVCCAECGIEIDRLRLPK